MIGFEFFDTAHNRKLMSKKEEDPRCIYCKREIPAEEFVYSDDGDFAHEWCEQQYGVKDPMEGKEDYPDMQELLDEEARYEEKYGK